MRATSGRSRVVGLKGPRSLCATNIITKKIADLEKLIAAKVKESGTTLTALHGIGFVNCREDPRRGR
jgi:hypothetical protein